MQTPTRNTWIALGAVAYIGVAAAQSQEGRWWAWLGALCLPLVLLDLWRRMSSAPTNEHQVDATSHQALRVVTWSIALWLAARLGLPGKAGFDSVANAACGIASVAALVGLARVPDRGGLLAAVRAARSFDAAAFAALLWAVATALPAGYALLPTPSVRFDPLVVDYTTSAAGLGSLLLLVVATARVRWLRRLELGVSERASAALALTSTAALFAIPAAVLDLAPPDRLLPLTVLATSLGVALTASVRDAAVVARALRGILAVMILGGPTTLLFAVAVRTFPQHSSALVLVASAVSVAAGLLIQRAARPLAPEQNRWLAAVAQAHEAAVEPHPETALRATLEALRRATSAAGARPELWRLAPAEALSVDIAGYLHREPADAPASLCALASAEPERTLRVEVLRAAQVRHAETRPLLSWFEARGALAATVIMEDSGPSGFILMPSGNRLSSLSLEEARAQRRLADRISALLALSSSLHRSQARELEMARSLSESQEELRRLGGEFEHQAERHAAVTEYLSRPRVAGAFSSTMRFAMSELERLSAQHQPLLLELPPGADALSWAALAHLKSDRPRSPFLVASGLDAQLHRLPTWQDEGHSPLELARGGTLALLDVAALPSTIQDHLALALVELPRQPSAPSLRVVATSERPWQDLRASGAITPALARVLGDKVVVFPALAERAEDLRALVVEAFTRWGLRLRGEPLGVDAPALAWLVDHPWPGNLLELETTALIAALTAPAPRVTLEDLQRAGSWSAREGARLGERTPLPSDRVLSRSRRRRRPPD